VKRAAAILAAALMLGACRLQQPWEAPGAAAPAPVATVTANAAPMSRALTQAGVVLSVVPGEVHACAGRDHVVSKIHWQVSRPGVASVQVYVSSLSAGRKLFAEGAATGDAQTGDWMSARAVVELVDPRTNTVLASHTMGVLPCE
jgi:hypothetical protein